MKNNTTAWLVAVLVVVIIIIYSVGHTPTSQPQPNGALAVTVSYSCDAGKSVAATYTNGAADASAMTASSTASSTMPTPAGKVALILGDGRTMNLNQTVSADGARYANADESFVFWSKGNSAFVTEAGQNTYTGCVALSPVSDGLPQSYSNSTDGFSVRLPSGYVADASYRYQNLPGKTISGVKFTIPASMAAGTNLSSDSYVSVEQMPQAAVCSAALFLNGGTSAVSIKDGNTTYSTASSSDAGAGNRYEETVYAIPGTSPCLGVRYFVHYGEIGNYPTDGSVKEFSKQALISQFDSIRRTLTLAR